MKVKRLLNSFPGKTLDEILEAIKKLPSQEKTIIELYYGLNGQERKSAEEIAKAFNYTTEYIKTSKILLIKNKIKKILTTPDLLEKDKPTSHQKKSLRRNENGHRKGLLNSFPGKTLDEILEAINKLSNQDKQIMELYYGLNGQEAKSKKEIATNFGYAGHYIYTKINNIKKVVQAILDNKLPYNYNNKRVNMSLRLKNLLAFFPNNTLDDIIEASTKLPADDKMIIELYYGLNGQEAKSKKEIATNFGYAESYISRKLNKVKNKLKNILNNSELLEEGINENIRQKRLLNSFPGRTLDEILEALNKLSSQEKTIMELYYGLNNKKAVNFIDIADKFHYAEKYVHIKIYNIRNKIMKILINPDFLETNTNKSKIGLVDFFPNKTRDEILEAINKLSNQDKKFIELYYGLNGQQSLTASEIAKDFGYKKQYIYGRINKIKKMLQVILDNKPFPGVGKRKVHPSMRLNNLLDFFPNNTLDDIVKALTKLPEEDKIIFELFYGLNGQQAQSTSEIAKTFNYTIKYIKSNKIAIIKNKLKNILNNPELLEEDINTSERQNGLLNSFSGKTFEEILEAINKLSNRQKKTMELYYGLNGQKELSLQEIADNFGYKEKSMYSKINNIKKSIQNIFNEQGIEIKTEESDNSSLNIKQALLLRKMQLSNAIEFETYKAQVKMLISLLENPEEQLVLLLSLGYIRNKYFSLQEISEILNISKVSVNNIKKRGLINLNELGTLSLNGAIVAKRILENKKPE